jgi:hypothetical protein
MVEEVVCYNRGCGKKFFDGGDEDAPGTVWSSSPLFNQ